MRLNVQERFALLGLLPQAGDFTTLRIVRELREMLSFSEEEHTLLQFVIGEDGKSVTWDATRDPFQDFDFGWKKLDVIRQALKKADKDKKLTLDQMPVYEKFLGEEDESEPGGEDKGRSPARDRIGGEAAPIALRTS